MLVRGICEQMTKLMGVLVVLPAWGFPLQSSALGHVL